MFGHHYHLQNKSKIPSINWQEHYFLEQSLMVVSFSLCRNSKILPRNQQQKPPNRSNIRKPTVTSAKKNDVKPTARNNQKPNGTEDRKNASGNNTNNGKKDDVNKVGYFFIKTSMLLPVDSENHFLFFLMP